MIVNQEKLEQALQHWNLNMLEFAFLMYPDDFNKYQRGDGAEIKNGATDKLKQHFLSSRIYKDKEKDIRKAEKLLQTKLT